MPSAISNLLLTVSLSLPISMMLEITYGYKCAGEDDRFVLGAETLVHNFGDATFISKYAVNWLPFCMSYHSCISAGFSAAPLFSGVHS